MNRRLLLGVNIDHVATLRQARRVAYPDPVEAAPLRRAGGRRRHHGPPARGPPPHPGPRRRDAAPRGARAARTSRWRRPRRCVAMALALRPDDACIVPERREELTTEGGLDVAGQRRALARSVAALQRRRHPREPVHRSRAVARSGLRAESWGDGRRASHGHIRRSARSIPAGLRAHAACDRQPDARLRLGLQRERRSRAAPRQRRNRWRRSPRSSSSTSDIRSSRAPCSWGWKARCARCAPRSIRRDGPLEAAPGFAGSQGAARGAGPPVCGDRRGDAPPRCADDRERHAGRRADGARRQRLPRKCCASASRWSSAAAWSSWPARETMAATPSSSPGTFADGGFPCWCFSLRRKRVCRATRGRTCSVGSGCAGLVRRDDVRKLIALAEATAGAGVLVDGLFGTGLRGEIDEPSRAIIEILNSAPAPILAVDVPSGLDADRGVPLGAVVQATVTATFGFPKLGLLLHPGAELAGEVVLADIGIDADAVARGRSPRARLLTPDAVAASLPPRASDSHKGSYGHVLIAAGALGKSGAAVAVWPRRAARGRRARDARFSGAGSRRTAGRHPRADDAAARGRRRGMDVRIRGACALPRSARGQGLGGARTRNRRDPRDSGPHPMARRILTGSAGHRRRRAQLSRGSICRA